jgi:Uma2 family endonuclease
MDLCPQQVAKSGRGAEAMSRLSNHKRRAVLEPTWEIARLFPLQGEWSEEDYLALDTNLPIELSNGQLEFLPMPTDLHQALLLFLYDMLNRFVTLNRLGTVRVSALPVRLWSGKIREPDILFMLKEHDARRLVHFWRGADLVMEIVRGDPESRRRDLKEKRQEYAKARIPEYWIVDPRDEKIIVLRLIGKRYVVHGEFTEGMTATSHLLPGFSIDVTAAFATQELKGRKPNERRAK